MRKIKCEYCGAEFNVDIDETTIARCPHCLKEFDVPVAQGSQRATVPEWPNVLPYRVPDKTGVRAGPFTLGFFGTLAFSAAAFICMGITFDAPMPVHIVVLALVIASYLGISVWARRLSKQPKWTGIGRGVIVGFCLSLIAIVPCAGIYVSTNVLNI